MPVVKSFSQFGAGHWETGSLTLVLRHKGVVSPHTGKPISEAFCFGLSGGACMGYFSFAYQGFDPHVALLLRNTFDPFEKMLNRLGVVRDSIQSGSIEQANKKLTDSLDDGEPVIVWADIFSLPYNGLDPKAMWQYYPVVVFGIDGGKVLLSDRFNQAILVDQALFDNARSRVKKERFRAMTVDLLSTDRFAAGTEEAIRECLKLFFDGPEGNIPNANFGTRAFEQWAKLLTRDAEKQSWAKIFPPGRPMLAGLISAHGGMMGAGNAERSRNAQADFLDEAAILLQKPALTQASVLFRKAATSWSAFRRLLLPEDVDLFRNAAELNDKIQLLFREKGPAAEAELRVTGAEQKKLLERAEKDFPLSAEQSKALRANLADALMELSEFDHAAFKAMGDAVAWTATS